MICYVISIFKLKIKKYELQIFIFIFTMMKSTIELIQTTAYCNSSKKIERLNCGEMRNIHFDIKSY